MWLYFCGYFSSTSLLYAAMPIPAAVKDSIAIHVHERAAGLLYLLAMISSYRIHSSSEPIPAAVKDSNAIHVHERAAELLHFLAIVVQDTQLLGPCRARRPRQSNDGANVPSLNASHVIVL